MATLEKPALNAEWLWVCQTVSYWRAKLPSKLLVGLGLLCLSLLFTGLYRWPHHYNTLASTQQEAELVWRRNCWDAEKGSPIFLRTIDCDLNKGYMEMNVFVSTIGDIVKEMWRSFEHFFTVRIRRACSSVLGFIGLKALSDIFSFATIALVGLVAIVYFIFYQSSKHSASLERVLERALSLTQQQRQFAQTQPRSRTPKVLASAEGQSSIPLPSSVYHDVEYGVEINE